MKELKERVMAEGLSLGGGILKVDSFINHQVDPRLMEACGKELAEKLINTRPTRVLTAEISGIAPALMTAKYLNIPVVFARKTKPVTMPDQVYLTLAPSHTKGRMVELIVSPEYLSKGERVLIVDDFLSTGTTILGLIRLAQAAGAEVVGVGTLLEKDFEGGRKALEFLNIPIESLVCILSMDDDTIILKD